MNIRLTFFLFLLVLCSDLSGQSAFAKKLADIAESISGDVGIAIRAIERGDTLSYHGGHPFPMQSVYKFPLALQVLNDVDNGKLNLDKHVSVLPTEYYDTHSPLMKDYPDGYANPSIRELLTYLIEWSDNVACDVLFKEVGGPKRVDLFINAQGIRDMAVRNTEREMHANDQLQYQNWSTPRAMVDLLVRFYTTNMLSSASRVQLWKLMINTKTGPNRIRGLLPAGTVVANRTGTGNISKDRRVSAVNDVGIIELPSGEHLAIAVYITNTREEIPTAEEVIARISKEAYDHYGQRK
jgi:beta-lactamase class A